MWGASPVTKARLAEIGAENSPTRIVVAKRNLATSPTWRDGRLLPMTSPTPPIAAAAKQQHQNDDDEDQFHKKSPWLS